MSPMDTIPAVADDVSSISDAALVERAVRNSAHGRERKSFRWVHIMEAFALGSTFAAQLCRRFGLDPDEEIGEWPEDARGELCAVCEGPNTYDPISGVCARCQDVLDDESDLDAKSGDFDPKRDAEIEAAAVSALKEEPTADDWYVAIARRFSPALARSIRADADALHREAILVCVTADASRRAKLSLHAEGKRDLAKRKITITDHEARTSKTGSVEPGLLATLVAQLDA